MTSRTFRPTSEYLYAGARLVSRTDVTPEGHSLRDALYQGYFSKEYYGEDPQGSVMLTTNERGQRRERYEYDPWGRLTEGHFDRVNELGYNGKRVDAVTGWYDYGFRDYAPMVARFTTVDPVRDGANWYAYVGNDPVNYVDPLGLTASDKNDGPDPKLAPSVMGISYPVGYGKSVEEMSKKYQIGSDIGPREPFVTNSGITDPLHRGVDIPAPEGTRINAVAQGKITETGNQPQGLGNFIRVKHPNGSVTVYGHLSKIFVKAGEDVETGQHIGNVGNTGKSEGPHLHFAFDGNGDGDYDDVIPESEFSVAPDDPRRILGGVN